MLQSLRVKASTSVQGLAVVVASAAALQVQYTVSYCGRAVVHGHIRQFYLTGS